MCEMCLLGPTLANGSNLTKRFLVRSLRFKFREMNLQTSSVGGNKRIHFLPHPNALTLLEPLSRLLGLACAREDKRRAEIAVGAGSIVMS